VLRARRGGQALRRPRLYDASICSIERGQRVALVVPNGAGKTTLLKILRAWLAARRRSCSVGREVQLGYFAQDHAEMLDRDRTGLEE
jgi:ATP-binding cassette subfamily F protein 3